VREAVIQTILRVAREFPVIRLDAAMTLAKRHYQRLWFPEPGSGGAIPSRAERGLTKEEFDRAMPVEFWREVVDRVGAESPDTLLLAEAFWLMEGYFVRTLGMHRVYNSAFMNMLRDEDNAKYRSVMKNTLEFEPEVLRRFVNFMNNPDEETAVAQFGKGDKYFGICTMMVTLPGLPMFGHGQIEGLAERYGMEYRRAYWDEQADGDLVARHQREIFPLLHRRYLFAEVEDFRLYDFFTAEGYINEDVFAYSNRAGAERALVVYHNKFATARGWIKASVAYSKAGDSGDRVLLQKTLGEGLGLRNDANEFSIFRDALTGLEYIRNNRDLWDNGLYVELAAYKCHIFLDWREVRDNEWHQYAHLADYLAGSGVPSFEEAVREVFLQPVHSPFRELVNAGQFRWLIEHRVTSPVEEPGLAPVVEEVEGKVLHLLREMKQFTAGGGDEAAITQEIRLRLEASLQLPVLATRFPLPESSTYEAAVGRLQSHLDGDPATWGSLLAWLFTHTLGRVVGESGDTARSRSWMDEWLLSKLVAGALQDLGLEEAAAWWAVGTVKILISHQGWWQIEAPAGERAYHVLVSWLKDSEVQQFLRVNRYRGVLWFNHEAFEQLLNWMLAIAAVQISADPDRPADQIAGDIATCGEVMQRLQQAENESEYQVVKLMEAAKA
jgi:hypothetical protein